MTKQLPEGHPLLSYPKFHTGSSALQAFLENTQNTPTVGQTIFQFTIEAFKERDAHNFVQAMRSCLSKQRAKFKRKTGRAPQRFTMQIASITFFKDEQVALIALGRKQRGQGLNETLGIEMMQLLTKNYNTDNTKWKAMLEALREKPEILIDATNWDDVALAVILTYQQNAVYKGFDIEKNAHIIARI